MKPLLQEKDLREWLGFKRRADLVRWLDQKKIRYEYAREEVVTTLEAVNERFRTEVEEFEFDG